MDGIVIDLVSILVIMVCLIGTGLLMLYKQIDHKLKRLEGIEKLLQAIIGAGEEPNNNTNNKERVENH